MKDPLEDKGRDEYLRNYKSPIDFTPDLEYMRERIANLPPVSEERAAFLMRGKKPETSITEDVSELALRIDYNAFLCTPGSPLWDFEQWKANRSSAA